MGRITVFTGPDLHSKRVKDAFDSRNIPIIEISMIEYPNKLVDLKNLCGVLSVPQVFVNELWIGGADATLTELGKWDMATDEFETPLERYEKQVEAEDDPTKPGLALPDEDAAVEDDEPPSRDEISNISLMDGTSTSIRDITSKLRKSIPLVEVEYEDITYRNTFTGETFITTVREMLEISTKKANKFGQHLLDMKVIEGFESGEAFDDSDEACYRLQCHIKTDVLNSFRICEESSGLSWEELFDHLDSLMGEIETDSIDKNGILDYAAALSHKKYSYFEDGACELQLVNLEDLEDREQIAFGLNVYNLMMKYAFIKFGIPCSETDRKSLVSFVKFNVGGTLYTFHEWVACVVRSDTALEKMIHFAMNNGSTMGLSTSPPFQKFTPAGLGKELAISARVFFEEPENAYADMEKKIIYLSKVLSWGRSDFAKKDKDFLDSLLVYFWGRKKSDIEKLIGLTEELNLSFRDVNYARYACNYTKYDEKAVRGDDKFQNRFVEGTPAHEHELLRLATLRELEVLDTSKEERFDRITRMAQATFEVPIALISLVDEHREWYKSRQWQISMPPLEERTRENSLCDHTIRGREKEILCIENALEDKRFKDHPQVTGPTKVRFYAGYPLAVPSESGEKVNIGTLCIVDQKPREFEEKDRKRLRAMTRQIRDEILRKDGGDGGSFVSPATPDNEEIRLETLNSLDILDTDAEERYDKITRMAQAYYQVPFVFVTLVDANRQWMKSTQWNGCKPGPPPPQFGRDISICGHTILGEDVFWIDDASKDDRFAANPLVDGPLKLRFYAGVPIRVPADTGELVNVGTLCLIDQKPRKHDDTDESQLVAFAQQVTDEVLRHHPDRQRLLLATDEEGEEAEEEQEPEVDEGKQAPTKDEEEEEAAAAEEEDAESEDEKAEDEEQKDDDDEEKEKEQNVEEEVDEKEPAEEEPKPEAAPPAEDVAKTDSVGFEANFDEVGGEAASSDNNDNEETPDDAANEEGEETEEAAAAGSKGDKKGGKKLFGKIFGRFGKKKENEK